MKKQDLFPVFYLYNPATNMCICASSINTAHQQQSARAGFCFSFRRQNLSRLYGSVIGRYNYLWHKQKSAAVIVPF